MELGSSLEDLIMKSLIQNIGSGVSNSLEYSVTTSIWVKMYGSLMSSVRNIFEGFENLTIGNDL